MREIFDHKSGLANDPSDTLPVFPPSGSRVRVPAPGGGYHVTWTMGEARTVDGEIVIRCAGEGDVKVQEVRECKR